MPSHPRQNDVRLCLRCYKGFEDNVSMSNHKDNTMQTKTKQTHDQQSSEERMRFYSQQCSQSREEQQRWSQLQEERSSSSAGRHRVREHDTQHAKHVDFRLSCGKQQQKLLGNSKHDGAVELCRATRSTRGRDVSSLSASALRRRNRKPSLYRAAATSWDHTASGKPSQHSWVSREHRERRTRTVQTFSRVPRRWNNHDTTVAFSTDLNHVENTSRRKQEETSMTFCSQDGNRTSNAFWRKHATN